MKRAENFAFDLLKWFATSFFVLNGGALVAAIGIAGREAEIIRGAGPYFALGIAGAVIGAFILALCFSAQAHGISKELWDLKVMEIEKSDQRFSTNIPSVIFLFSFVCLLFSVSFHLLFLFQSYSLLEKLLLLHKTPAFLIYQKDLEYYL